MMKGLEGGDGGDGGGSWGRGPGDGGRGRPFWLLVMAMSSLRKIRTSNSKIGDLLSISIHHFNYEPPVNSSSNRPPMRFYC
jgi:hypothetical protein